jgi:hypothetical protein
MGANPAVREVTRFSGLKERGRREPYRQLHCRSIHDGWMDDGAQPFALECRMNLSAIFPHYLLRVNATEVILANDRDDQCAP